MPNNFDEFKDLFSSGGIAFTPTQAGVMCHMEYQVEKMEDFGNLPPELMLHVAMVHGFNLALTLAKYQPKFFADNLHAMILSNLPSDSIMAKETRKHIEKHVADPGNDKQKKAQWN